MLRRPSIDPAQLPVRPDPIATITACLLAVICVGLLAAAVSAIYTYSTPTWEGPLVLVLSALSAATLVINIAAMTTRHFRRSAVA